MENDEKSIGDQLDSLALVPLAFENYVDRQLDLAYRADFLPPTVAAALFDYCERSFTYYDDDAARVLVYGKWRQIPRRQTAFGNAGLTYRFSGAHVPARPWD